MILDKLVKYPIYLLVFLLPLIFSPWTFEAYELPKQFLLFFLISIAFLAWLSKTLFGCVTSKSAGGHRGPSLRLRRTPLDIPILVFTGIAVLSGIFSVDKFSSLFGFYGRFSNGLLGLISCVMLYFVIVNNVDGRPHGSAIAGGPRVAPAKIIKIFLISLGLVVLISYFSIFGVWQKMEFLPRIMQQRTFSPASASFYRFLAPVSLVNLPEEVVLTGAEGWRIAGRTVLNSPKNFFFGTGPGTFHYDFAKFKSIEDGQGAVPGLSSRQWQVRFDRAGSHIAEITATTGISGLISYLGVIGMFLLASYFIISNVKRQTSEADVKCQIFLFFVVIGLFVVQFFYYQNTILAFSFWLFLGLSAAGWPGRRKFVSLAPTAKTKRYKAADAYVSVGLLLCLGAGLVIGCCFLAKFFWADAVYADRFANSKGEIAALEKAARLNPYCAQYRIVLSRAYFNQTLKEMQKPSDERDDVGMSVYIERAIAYLRGGEVLEGGESVVRLKGAIELSPNLVSGWETLAMIYRDIRTAADGASEWAVKAFEKAVQLEPGNPIHHTELGKLYVEAGDIGKGRKEFGIAADLKPDYVDALTENALTYEKEGNLEAAVQKMETLTRSFPLLPEVFFQMGRLYFNQGETDKAVEQFERVLVLMPNHSNALYSLAVVWKAKGDRDRALEYFERVLELNPESEDVKVKIMELEK